MPCMLQEPLVIEDLPGSSAAQRVLRLKGPILLNNLFDFQNRVRSNISPVLILDFSDVPYIDSAGIGALIGAYVNHNKKGRSLALVGVTDRVRNSLKVTQVEQFFRFYESVSAAQAA
jgi:anti-sigma B factor antagonist